MVYVKVNWVDGTTPVNAAKLGQMDQGIADVEAAQIPKALVDAAGDLIVGSAADVVSRLAAPTTDGHVLTADLAQPLKTKWAAPSGGGSADLVYNGEYPAATPYTDGDIVIYGGQAYLCVRPTSNPPVPWALGARSFYGTTPPASPAEGDEWTLPVGNGVAWRFRYNAGSASAYKWEFIGGPPIASYIPTAQSTATTGAWVNLATDGPLLIVPRGGDYAITYGVITSDTIVTAVNTGVAVGDTAPFHNVLVSIPGGGYNVTLTSEVARACVASEAIKLRYYNSAGTATWSSRWLKILPVRVA